MPEIQNIHEFVTIETISSENLLVFKFVGKMDYSICDNLSSYILNKLEDFSTDIIDKSKLKINFDLEEVSYVSSLFLRVCFVAIKHIPRGNFTVLNATPQVNDILKMSGLDRVAKILNVQDNGIVIHPPEHFSKNANIESFEEYKKLYTQSINEPETFWRNQALENIKWFSKFDDVLKWELPVAQWFVNGKLNVSYNCLDKHLETPTADKIALIWEGEPYNNGKPIDKKTLTYKQLHLEVCRFSNVLKNMGITKGDRVIIYLPMMPEAVVSMLACARIGAIHSVIFAGFSSQAIADRASDCQAKMIITSDGGYRKGKIVPLKQNVDDAFNHKDENGNHLCNCIDHVLVIKRTDEKVSMKQERDYWLHDELFKVDSESQPEVMDSEDVLFILYTSGSTGKPKGLFHSTAGYLLGAMLSFKYIFDYKDDDIFWCTADVGWVTGHSYVVYGPLANGSTVFLYEGAPDYPQPDRFWEIIEKNKISIFYTAPTAIRAFMKWGEKWVEKYDLSSLRLLGSVGEPINPEAWIWYYENIGKKNCPIVDTWWQTETGSIMISGLPGAIDMKPGSASLPFFGILPEIVDEEGHPIEPNTNGKLIIKRPWPSMARGIWTSAKRYFEVYWSQVPGAYFTGDSARKDNDGYFWIVGRVDDVIVVSGHNIGTAEVENAIESHHSVAEAAVVGRPDDHKTTVIIAFVSLKEGKTPSKELEAELRQHIINDIGHIAKPEEIRFTESLPKTRSGKIMRRFLRQIAAGTEITGDITTLEDFSVLEKLK